MGNTMSSLWSTKSDPKVSATISDKPATHHNVAKHIDMAEQAKVPETSAGLEQAAEMSKERLPDTIDMSERAKLDWSKTKPAGPPVDVKTGNVIKAGEDVTGARLPTRARASQRGSILVPNASEVETLAQGVEAVAVVGALGVGGKDEGTSWEIVAEMAIASAVTRAVAPSVGKALASPPGLVTAAAAGGVVAGFVIENELPQYTAHTADVGSRVGKATGSSTAGGIATAVTTLPLIWLATKAYDLATRQ